MGSGSQRDEQDEGSAWAVGSEGAYVWVDGVNTTAGGAPGRVEDIDLARVTK